MTPYHNKLLKVEILFDVLYLLPLILLTHLHSLLTLLALDKLLLFVRDSYTLLIGVLELCKKFDEEKARPFLNGVLNGIKDEIVGARNG